MYRMELIKLIERIISLFYFLGLWHRGDVTVKETIIKLFFSFYYLLFPLSLMAGAIAAENKDEKIFLAAVSIISSVMAVKVFFIIWNKRKILEMLRQCGVFSILDQGNFNLVNDTLKSSEKFITVVLVTITFIAFFMAGIWPFLVSERKLFFNILFVPEWKKSEIAFWFAYTLILTEVMFSVNTFLLTVIIWYLLMTTTLRFEVLGNQLKSLGQLAENMAKCTNKKKQKVFLRDLVQAIHSHRQIRKLVQKLESFLSTISLVTILTSGASICGSIYCLAFGVGANPVDNLFYVICALYSITEIFIATYLGNSIYIFSGRLSYCVFESNWLDQPQSTEKCIIIFGELLKKPQMLVIGKVYPLTLATFTSILKSAYSMFNILQNLK